MESSKPGDQSSDGKGRSAGTKLIGVLFLFAILIGVLFLVVGLAPTDLPPDKDSNFVDTVFHNKGVVLAARLLLVSAAIVLAIGGVFIVSSIAMRMRNGEWLRRAGPFEIQGGELREVDSAVRYWRAIATASQGRSEELSERLETAEGLVREVHEKTDEGVQV